MARIRIQDENREITDSQEICAFLQPFGIWYEKWEVAGRIGPEATNEEILAAYAPARTLGIGSVDLRTLQGRTRVLCAPLFENYHVPIFKPRRRTASAHQFQR